ncbi:MAG: hypothetical protein IKP72_01965 [Clostridia bacterium]|nr:hypothetical protein [Clostridia bacterium]MBR4331425.1 hypothetical protein [Clostridia bacterium]
MREMIAFMNRNGAPALIVTGGALLLLFLLFLIAAFKASSRADEQSERAWAAWHAAHSKPNPEMTGAAHE